MKFAFVQASTDPSQESISLVWTFYAGMERTGTITCRISEDAEESEPEWADALFESAEACDFVLTSGKQTERNIIQLFQIYGMENRMRFISLRELEKLIRRMQLKQRVTYTSKTYLTGTKRYPERYLWLLSLLPADFISILKKSRESILPGHLAEFIRNEIPGVPGVYYFLDRNRRPLYIGKASDLKKRVISHFSASEEITKLFRLYLDVHTVEFEPTGSFLLAGLLEDHEIRHYWPSMNKAQKNPKNRYSIVAMAGRSGEIRLNITVSGRAEDGIAQFHSYPKAVSYLSELLERSQLDASASAIRLHKPQLAADNKTVDREKVIRQLQKFRELSIYTLPGRRAGETGFVALDNGAFCGYGYLGDRVITADVEPSVLANLYRCRASITTEKLLNELTAEATPAAVFKVKKGAIPSGTAPRYARALTFDFLQ